MAWNPRWMQEGELLGLCSTSLIWIAIKQLTSGVSFKNEGARRTCFTVLELYTLRDELVVCCHWQVKVISCYKPSKLEALEAKLKWERFKIRVFDGPWIWASVICQPSILSHLSSKCRPVSLQPSWLQRPVGHSVQLEDLGVLHVPEGHTKPVTYQKQALNGILIANLFHYSTWSRNCINRLQFIRDLLIWILHYFFL